MDWRYDASLLAIAVAGNVKLYNPRQKGFSRESAISKSIFPL